MPYADPEKRKQCQKLAEQRYREKNPDKIAQLSKARWARMTPEERQTKNERMRIAREKKRIEEGRPKGYAHLIKPDEEKRETERAKRKRYRQRHGKRMNKKAAAKARERYQGDPEYRDEVKRKSYERDLRAIKNLSNRYVARKLGLVIAQCPEDLLEAKRELIRAKRQLREQQQPDQQHAPES